MGRDCRQAVSGAPNSVVRADPDSRKSTRVRASSDSRKRRFSAFVWAGLILLLLGLTYAALTPRPDWYDAPFRLWPLRFRFVYGRFGTDKIEHVAAAFGLTLAVAFALDGFRPSAQAVRRSVVSIQLWCMAIEIIQGFLPYR